MRRILVILLPALAVTAAGVSLASCSSSRVEGTLTGTLEAVGDVRGDNPRPISGQITLHGESGNIATITLGANGRFSVPLAVGTYALSAWSPHYEGGTAECRALEPVSVTKGDTSTVHVECREK